LDRFTFGRNWQKYVAEYLDDAALKSSVDSLVAFSKSADWFRGKSFLDIGCGSGLFSLAAMKLGATRVVSFDVDPDSVSCCRYLRQQYGSPDHWEVLQGSVLDPYFVGGLGTFDYVYSWGVLHHSGDMWTAIKNAASLVSPEGFLYIAIYNRADGFAVYPDGRFGPSSFWNVVKRTYSGLPALARQVVDYSAMSLLVLAYVATLQNPIRKIREFGANHRGMSWQIDIRDWLGGYPYEYARSDEIFLFVKNLGFMLENLKCNNGLLNNEFLFKKAG
jgi:SAM-dependent methyltransferase